MDAFCLEDRKDLKQLLLPRFELISIPSVPAFHIAVFDFAVIPNAMHVVFRCLNFGVRPCLTVRLYEPETPAMLCFGI